MDFMNDNASVIIPFLGMVTACMVWLQLRTQLRMKDKDAKLETLETNQIKIQSDADNQKAQMDVLQQVIANDAKSDERWQSVVSAMSERRREGDQLIADAIKRIDGNIERNATAIIDLKSFLEIQSAQLLNVAEASRRAETASRKALKAVTDKTQAIENRIKTLERELLEIRETQETYVLQQGERHIAIENELKMRFANVESQIEVLKTDVSSILDILNPPPTKPPNSIPLKQPEEKTA